MTGGEYEALLLEAPADGVGPSVLFSSLAPQKPLQLLFNVPEGFSRLTLEHKVRPGAGLAGVFLTSLSSSSVGGLAGLILRLSQDGHGQVQVVGPPGTAAYIHALRHLIRWKHPKVLVTEVSSERAESFSSGLTTVLPLFPHTYCPDCPTCTARESMDPEPKPSHEKVDRSSSESSDSTGTLSSQGVGRETTEEETVSSEESSESDKPQLMGGLFDDLDEVFSTSQGERSARRKEALKHLTKFKQRNEGKSNLAGAGCKRKQAESEAKAGKLLEADEGKESPEKQDRQQTEAEASKFQKLDSLFAAKSDLAALRSQALRTLTATRAPLPKKKPQLVVPPSVPDLHSTRSSMSLKVDLEGAVPDQGNPVCVKFGTVFKRLADCLNQSQTKDGRLLGYLCHFSSPVKAAALVIDCPTKEAITALQSLRLPPCLRKQDGHGLNLLVHLTRPEVTAEEGYQKWMASWGPNVRQVLMSADPTLGYVASLKTLARLNTVDPRVFPLPPCPSVPQTSSGSVTLGKLLLRVRLKQSSQGELAPVDTSSCPREVHYKVLKKELLEKNSELEDMCHQWQSKAHCLASGLTPNQLAAQQLRNRLLPRAPKTESQRPAPEQAGQPGVVFLGTGSAEPSKYRGSSGILVEQEGGAMLLDAGEATAGQLLRHSKTIESLSCIWVSHKHADHALGLPAFLELHPRGTVTTSGGEPLVVIGPTAVQLWLAELSSALEATGSPLPSYQFIHCRDSTSSLHSMKKEAPLRKVLERLGLQSLQAVPVEHCADAWGVVLRHPQGWSLVYSGDTRPSPALVQAGRGCSLLIHEATFEGRLREHALRKRHSTVEEALEVAARMAAKRVVLTHFSQRYPRVVAFPVTAGAFACVAFDGMHVPFSMLDCLPGIMGPVKAVLEAAEAVDADKAEGPLELTGSKEVVIVRDAKGKSMSTKGIIGDILRSCELRTSREEAHVQWSCQENSGGGLRRDSYRHVDPAWPRSNQQHTSRAPYVQSVRTDVERVSSTRYVQAKHIRFDTDD